MTHRTAAQAARRTAPARAAPLHPTATGTAPRRTNGQWQRPGAMQLSGVLCAALLVHAAAASSGTASGGTGARAWAGWQGPEAQLAAHTARTSNSAVTFSGGGTRAFNIVMGALRCAASGPPPGPPPLPPSPPLANQCFRDKQIERAPFSSARSSMLDTGLNRTRYMAGVSGGGWAVTVFGYRQTGYKLSHQAGGRGCAPILFRGGVRVCACVRGYGCT